MVIHVYVLCYNEEIMLPYFLRHYGTFAEKIIIYDNYSTDRTLEIARDNPLTEVVQYDSGNEIRDDIYLKIKNNAWKASRGIADYVVMVDMDEFLYNPDIFSALKDRPSIICPLGYEMVSDVIPSGTGQIYDEIIMGMTSPGYNKCVLFNPNIIEEMNYRPGCHNCIPIGAEAPPGPIGDFKLLHYKHLSADYVITRYKAFNKRLSRTNKDNNWGYQYAFTEEEIRQYHNEVKFYSVPVVTPAFLASR